MGPHPAGPRRPERPAKQRSEPQPRRKTARITRITTISVLLHHLAAHTTTSARMRRRRLSVATSCPLAVTCRATTASALPNWIGMDEHRVRHTNAADGH